MSSWSVLSELALEIDGYELDGLEQGTAGGFLRRTTVVRLLGAGEEGVGEDVGYDPTDHEALQTAPRDLPLAGRHTLGSFSELVGRLDLFPRPARWEAYRNYRRWAFESAALDLALRQAGRSLAEAVGREPAPLRYVVSMRLPDPPGAEPLRRLLDRYPRLRFKLDPTSAWTDEVVAEIAALGVVDVVDLKGAYVGTPVDQAPDPPLYRRVAEAFPDAWIEDPALTPETEPALAPHRDRITWDAPLHSVADVADREPLRMINIKPSRFGSLRELLAVYEHCAERGIGAYGGGQFELGPGRGQIQYLASLFHPDGPNDVAPGAFNRTEPPDGLPQPPLDPAFEPVGFRRRA